MGRRVGWTTSIRDPEFISFLGRAPALAAIAGLVTVYLAWIIADSPALATKCVMFGLAGVGGIAVLVARWACAALAHLLDLLRLALNTAPDAQIIFGEDGRVA